MKQILTAGVLALLIHVLLFAMNFKWSGRRSIDITKPRALDMTLTSIPIKKAPKPALQKPKPIVKKKKSKPKPRPKPKPKRILKAPPKKTVPMPVQSKKTAIPETIPEKPAEKTESRFDSEQTESKELLKAAKPSAATTSPFNVIHEARPIYRLNPSPKYPRIARIRGYQGNVLLDVLVNTDGKVDDLKIYKSSGHPLLDRAAVSSVKRWLFEPGMIGEKKTDMWVRVPIRFELRE